MIKEVEDGWAAEKLKIEQERDRLKELCANLQQQLKEKQASK